MVTAPPLLAICLKMAFKIASSVRDLGIQEIRAAHLLPRRSDQRSRHSRTVSATPARTDQRAFRRPHRTASVHPVIAQRIVDAIDEKIILLYRSAIVCAWTNRSHVV